ncbi:hypothetical protein E2C01_085141 [Portunus trituberculatus]|uniref:Uncharacterized protein n=1 Tax=Portunus trituberculatus TaxID=210409 RepID=A0A5B7JB48_PORTR|nr:hypothetical protein [Portunus trituberculatus]
MSLLFPYLGNAMRQIPRCGLSRKWHRVSSRAVGVLGTKQLLSCPVVPLVILLVESA